MPSQYLRKSLKENKKSKRTIVVAPHSHGWLGGPFHRCALTYWEKSTKNSAPPTRGAHPEPYFLLLPTTEEGKLQRNVGVRAQLRIERGSDGTLKEAASLPRSQLAAPRHPVLWQFTRPPAPESLLDCSDAHQRQEPQLPEAWGLLAHLDRFSLAQHRGQTAMVFGWIISCLSFF